MSQLLHPKLTTIKQDTEEIGREAAKRLIGSIENQNNSHRESRYRRNPHTGTIGRKDSGTKITMQTRRKPKIKEEGFL